MLHCMNSFPSIISCHCLVAGESAAIFCSKTIIYVLVLPTSFTSHPGLACIKLASGFDRYLTAIAYEFFTAKSKGGVVLLAIYFYVTFVFAMLFWIDEGALVTPPSQDIDPTTGNNTLCGSLAGCALVLTRLTLYDGTGMISGF